MSEKVNRPTEFGADVQTVSEAVSRRIKQQRKNQKLSLDELSRRAGVSKGMLVEIEKGSANPSIAILCKLAAALGLSVADIVNVTRAPAAYLIESQDIPTLWHGDRGGLGPLAGWHPRPEHDRTVALGNGTGGSLCIGRPSGGHLRTAAR